MLSWVTFGSDGTEERRISYTYDPDGNLLTELQEDDDFPSAYSRTFTYDCP